MDSDISSSIKRSTYRVMFSNGAYGSCIMIVPQGSLEVFVVSALSAGIDISISAVDNASYRIL